MLDVSKVVTVPRTLTFDPPLKDDEYEQFCLINSDHNIERREDGIIVMNVAPGMQTSDAELEIASQLRAWWATANEKQGRVFGPSVEFLLPNGASRQPDAAYMTREQVAKLTSKEKIGFPRTCPVFVIELLSPTDREPRAREKMREWISNGALLGWLVLPKKRAVMVYRPKQKPQAITDGRRVHGEGPVEGFTLDLKPVWECYE